MVTFGVLSNAPVAVTSVFAPGEEAAEDEAEEDPEAVDFDELQPAMTRQASKGMAMSARKRRMKTSIVVDVSPASLLC
jgi:D-aminopeptidase